MRFQYSDEVIKMFGILHNSVCHYLELLQQTISPFGKLFSCLAFNRADGDQSSSHMLKTIHQPWHTLRYILQGRRRPRL